MSNTHSQLTSGNTHDIQMYMPAATISSGCCAPHQQPGAGGVLPALYLVFILQLRLLRVLFGLVAQLSIMHQATVNDASAPHSYSCVVGSRQWLQFDWRARVAFCSAILSLYCSVP